jgi:hypothetical protein
MAADAMSGGLKGAFSGEGHRQLAAGGPRKKSRRRELHPRPRIRKSFRSIAIASTPVPPVCILPAAIWHYGSWSQGGIC